MSRDQLFAVLIATVVTASIYGVLGAVLVAQW